MPLLPKLEGSSSTTTCMLCETVWTIQLSWNLYHFHNQTEKSKEVTQKNGAWHGNSLKVKISLYIGEEEMLTWSPASQIVSNKMAYICQLRLRNPLDCLTDVAEWAMVLPHIPQSIKNVSKAFLRCLAFPKEYSQNQAWVYNKVSSTSQPFCSNSFSIKNGIHDL